MGYLMTHPLVKNVTGLVSKLAGSEGKYFSSTTCGVPSFRSTHGSRVRMVVRILVRLGNSWCSNGQNPFLDKH